MIVLLPGEMVDYLHITTHHTFVFPVVNVLMVLYLSTLIATDFFAIFPDPQIMKKSLVCYTYFFWRACIP